MIISECIDFLFIIYEASYVFVLADDLIKINSPWVALWGSENCVLVLDRADRSLIKHRGHLANAENACNEREPMYRIKALISSGGPRAPTRAGTEYHPHGRAL